MDVQPSRSKGKEWKVYLLREVEKFLRSRRVAPTRFGREAVGDPRFVFDFGAYDDDLADGRRWSTWLSVEPLTHAQYGPFRDHYLTPAMTRTRIPASPVRWRVE